MKLKIILSLISFLLIFEISLAIPSFSRQTGFSCHKCHSHHNHPSLTPFGRQFKAEGFVYVNTKMQKLIEEGNLLSITQNLNPSLIFKMRYLKENGHTGEFQIPEEGAVYMAGRVAKNAGFIFEFATFGNVEDDKINLFSSLKVPFTFKIDKNIIGVVPYITERLGSAYSFEVLNTGAVRNIRIVEFKNETSAQQYIGTDTPAEGLGIYLYNPQWYVVYSPWIPKHGEAKVKNFSHYFRVALTPHYKHWDLGAGVQVWSGESKLEEHTIEKLKTNAYAVDFQAMGHIGHNPLGLFLTYANAKNEEHSIFNSGTHNKKALVGLVEIGIVPDTINLGIAYRNATNENNEDDDAYTFSLKYIPFRNIELQFDYAVYTGETEIDNRWVFMFFGAF